KLAACDTLTVPGTPKWKSRGTGVAQSRDASQDQKGNTTVAFTDNCDLFASVHEDGVNRVIGHIRRQRPSWFNYATADIAGNRELWCSPIDVSRDVVEYQNSFFT